MQPFDFTTLTAICADLRTHWLPARLEQVYQCDRHTIAIALRTLDRRAWLTLSWHPQAARLCLGDPPPRAPDTFTFSQQLRHQLAGLALVAIEAIAPWERVVDLQFAQRPGEAALWHVYVEIMGQYSNVILTTAEQTIVTAAHQVNAQQSTLRVIQTGQPYERPPAQTDAMPSVEESLERWQDRISLVPGPLRRNLLKPYRGLSSALVKDLIGSAQLHPDQSTADLTPDDWQRLFQAWQTWLGAIAQQQFHPGWLPTGYTVLGWGSVGPEPESEPGSKPESEPDIQHLIHRYYTDQLNQQDFVQLRHHISQKVSAALKKLTVKAKEFRSRLQLSDQADQQRHQADLLMAYLHQWQPGMAQITLADFTTAEPITIPLQPEKNAVQNAQALYKRHQKLKRSRHALLPLLAEVQTELDYLEQVEVAIAQLDAYRTPDDLEALIEIRDELIQQDYLQDPDQRYRSSASVPTTNYLRYHTPGGFEVLIGRNNRQNDQLTFRLANEYDLWFHTQEIPGSHVLLRLEPGAVADDADLQFTANLAAYYSRARQGDHVPVVYTEPKQVFKPKGVKPGMVVYKQETVIWGQPQRGKEQATVQGSQKT